MRSAFAGAASLLFAFVAVARPTTPDEARLVASGWLQQNETAFGSQMGSVRSVTDEVNAAGETLWFVVRFDQGAMVVAPDTEIEPVIAVLPISDGVIPANNPLRAMLTRDLTRRLAAIRAQQAAPNPVNAFSVSRPRAKPTAADKWARLQMIGSGRLSSLFSQGNPNVVVKLLDGWSSANTEGDVQTLRFWNQDSSPSYFTNQQIFNLYTPNNYYCGCVATAGASVLHYFRVPYGRPGLEFVCEVGESMYETEPITLATKGGVYDWSLIDSTELRRNRPVALAAEQVDLLGRVAYDVGVSCQMVYSPEGSGSYTVRLAKGLESVFDLKSLQFVTASGREFGGSVDIGPENYANLIYNQIRAGAPVLFGIDGHEVVAVGYAYDYDKTDYTYIFLGWGGQNDAWYALPNIDTKATAEGGFYTSTFVDEIITEIAPDGRHIALVGRVTDEDGIGLEDMEITLPDESVVVTDANGYWGARIAPGEYVNEVIDPIGEGHSFTLGELGRRTTGSRPVGAAALAAAVPTAIDDIVIDDPTKILRIYSDYTGAVRKALGEGKLLYVFGGTDTNAVNELKKTMREEPEKYADFIVWKADPVKHTTLLTEEVQCGAFDPRVFNPGAAWDTANGLWDEPETWDDEDRSPTLFELVGPNAASSTKSFNHYRYQVRVSFADGLTVDDFARGLVTWALDDPAKGKLIAGDFNPALRADGVVTVTASIDALFGLAFSDSLEVTLFPETIKFSRPMPENGYNILATDDFAARNVEVIANKGVVTPSLKNGAELLAGGVYTAKANATMTIAKKAVFKCVGYELWDGDELLEKGAFDETTPDIGGPGTPTKQVGFVFTVTSPDLVVKWLWATERCWVQTASVNCTIDQAPQFVPCSEPLTISVKSPSGYELGDDLMAAWEGCDTSLGDVVGPTSASVRAVEPRSIRAIAVSKLAVSPVPEGVDVAKLALPTGYKAVKGGSASRPTVMVEIDRETLKPLTDILAIGPEGGVVVISNAAAGFAYVLKAKAELGGEWSEVARRVAAADGPLELVAPPAGASAFYAIEVISK